MNPTLIIGPMGPCVPIAQAYHEACIEDCLARDQSPYSAFKMLHSEHDHFDQEKVIKAAISMEEFMVKSGCKVVVYTDLGKYDRMTAFLDAPRAEIRRLPPELWNLVWIHCQKAKFLSACIHAVAGRCLPEGADHIKRILTAAERLYLNVPEEHYFDWSKES